MKPLVVIPARAGSKGLPGKNWKKLNGKSLIEYTVEAALELFDKSEICISSDSEEVINIANSLGLNVPFIRPPHLSNDTANSQDVLVHAIEFWQSKYYNPDVIILLQPTSPFRKSHHIKEALSIYNVSLDMVVSVKETKANPYYTLREENDLGYLIPSKLANFTRRQDCPKVYELNGAIYIINVKSLLENKMQNFKNIVKYEMDHISSVDIDDSLDWVFAETLLNKGLI